MPKHWSQQTWLTHPDKCNSYKNKYLQKAAGRWPTGTIRRQPRSRPLNPDIVDRNNYLWRDISTRRGRSLLATRHGHLTRNEPIFCSKGLLAGTSGGLFPPVPLSKQPPALKKTQYSNCSTGPSVFFACCLAPLSPHHLKRDGQNNLRWLLSPLHQHWK